MTEKEAKKRRGKDQGCRDEESKQREPNQQELQGGRAGRGSQEGYVEAHPAQPVEDFGERNLCSLAGNSLMGGL